MDSAGSYDLCIASFGYRMRTVQDFSFVIPAQAGTALE